MWGDWKKKGKKACKEERRQKREAWLKIEDRRMRISKKERKKGETKFRGLNDSGREAREDERARGDLHLHLHLHTPKQPSPSQPGHHGTFPVTGGGSRPHIAVNQSDCCNLRNPHSPAGSSCTQMLCANQEVRNHVLHAARASVQNRDLNISLCWNSWGLDTDNFGGNDETLSTLQQGVYVYTNKISASWKLTKELQIIFSFFFIFFN